MNWVIVVWSMVAATCLTLAGVHGFVWIRQRQALASLMFCFTATSTAGMAVCELWMMASETTDSYGRALQWFNFTLWMMTFSVVGFIHFYQGSGRDWLALLVCFLRTIAVILNFSLHPNVYYSSIDNLRHITFLHQTVTVADGTPNPLMLIGQLSLLLLAVYLVDATFQSYHRGHKKRALTVGTSIVFFVLALSLQTMLVFWDIVDAPIVSSLFFLGIVVAMGIELSDDMVRAAQLALDLQSREYELSRERELTDAIFQSAPGMLYLHSQDGRIVRWNAQHEKITGYQANQTSDLQVRDLFRKEDIPKLEQAWQLAFETGAHEVELDLIPKNGEPVRYFFTAVRVEINKTPHLVGIGIDISGQHALAQEASKQREEVAHLARIASMSELSSSLAHELNQPLSIILSNAQAAQRLMASQNPDIDEVREILDDIVSADIRAADVIKRLRSILRRGEPILEPVAPSDLFSNALGLVSTDIEGANILVTRRHSTKLPMIHADRIPVEQVLVNLIKNAIDAMSENAQRERQLYLTCMPDGSSLRFSVRDNGSGFPNGVEKIFEAFHTTKANGLGLGLTICQTIIQAHGGRLWAEANKTHGATFHFNLPCQALIS